MNRCRNLNKSPDFFDSLTDMTPLTDMTDLTDLTPLTSMTSLTPYWHKNLDRGRYAVIILDAFGNKWFLY
jgi:hypothetical protein